ncbi:hypothetical protein GCM10009836_10970 [Pseudonocardia ailaonensis]|uniref:Roadblock/LAMTOR2 domain-containing protein n=1 Tax=Pseudonocardia ailaonensis TaxID=367279 RepID=A0ABN2MR35_9PSEU
MTTGTTHEHTDGLATDPHGLAVVPAQRDPRDVLRDPRDPREFVRDALHIALSEVLDDAIGVSGALVATPDGMLVASDFRGMATGAGGAEPEVVAALSAAAAGLGAQFANVLLLGEASSTVVQGARGCVAVQQLPGRGVLVLFGNDGPNVARLHLAARQAVPRIEAALREEA